MKFNKLLRSTVESRMPHWRDHMIQYKQLKQAINKQEGKGGARPP